MAVPHELFQQQQYQPQPQQNQQVSTIFRNLCAINDQISPAVAYYNTQNIQDRSQHPPYIPPFLVEGFAPRPVMGTEGSDEGPDLQGNYGIEQNRKRLKEQDFLENNSLVSSVDFLQRHSVSTGLGLSLDNNRVASSTDSTLLSLIRDDVDSVIQRQDVEIDRFLKTQGDRLRQDILEKVQTTQLQLLSSVDAKVTQKLNEKEAELQSINKKNKELEDRIAQLTMESGVWQQRATYNEALITSLKCDLVTVHVQSGDSKEGCGDSEVDDTASCSNGRAFDFQLLNREGGNEQMTCKACRRNEVCMLLLPCKHLCLCKNCDSKLSFCPVCHTSKVIGMEIFM